MSGLPPLATEQRTFQIDSFVPEAVLNFRALFFPFAGTKGDFQRSESIDWGYRVMIGIDLLEALPVAVYTTDAEGRITFYNQAAADLWGCRPEIGSDRWCGSWRIFGPTAGLCRTMNARWPWRSRRDVRSVGLRL